MLGSGLYHRLSEDEKAVLRQYEERVAMCRERLKTGGECLYTGDSVHTSLADRPVATLQTYELSAAPGFPGSSTFTIETDHSESRQAQSKQLTPKQTSFRSSRAASTGGTPRRGLYAEPTYSSRKRSKSPKEGEAARRKATTHRHLQLNLVPNLEAEVGKLLRIVYRYSKESKELKSALAAESRLFRLYTAHKCHRA